MDPGWRLRSPSGSGSHPPTFPQKGESRTRPKVSRMGTSHLLWKFDTASRTPTLGTKARGPHGWSPTNICVYKFRQNYHDASDRSLHEPALLLDAYLRWDVLSKWRPLIDALVRCLRGPNESIRCGDRSLARYPTIGVLNTGPRFIESAPVIAGGRAKLPFTWTFSHTGDASFPYPTASCSAAMNEAKAGLQK